jgi:TfoX/Sxy family transcriptional regulator of competence genes
MVYDPTLAQRVREELLLKGVFEEKKMFGGIAFMYKGNMATGVLRDELILRVGLENYEAALAMPGTELFTPTGKPMAGWITVSSEGSRQDTDLARWINLALEFVKTLPAK